MMKTALAVLFLSLTVSSVTADEWVDVLYLSEGTVLRGRIVEELPNGDLRFFLLDRSDTNLRHHMVSFFGGLTGFSGNDYWLYVGLAYELTIGGFYFQVGLAPQITALLCDCCGCCVAVCGADAIRIAKPVVGSG